MSSVTSSTPSEEDVPGPGAQACPHCGETIESTFEFCPECNGYVEGELSVEDEGADGERPEVRHAGFAAVGLLTGLASFELLPFVLGPVSVLCGVQVFREHSEAVGLGVILLGAVGAVVGFIVGPIVGL